RHEEQLVIALEEKAARTGEQTLAIESRNPDRRQQQRLNHGCLCAYKQNLVSSAARFRGNYLSSAERVKSRRAKTQNQRRQPSKLHTLFRRIRGRWLHPGSRKTRLRAAASWL